MGAGVDVTFGSAQLSSFFSFLARRARSKADAETYAASRSAKMGSYSRREQEWAYQSNLAAGEITQTLKQLRAAQIREKVAQRELESHQRQMAHAREIEDFLADEKERKTSNKDLYAWMKREVRGLYSRCFELAFETAKKAERALQHELGDPGLQILRFDYRAGRQGLVAGEKLHLDLKRMDVAFLDQNRREYELTKNASLLQLDPTALLRLRATGSCELQLPEDLFDIDAPGHFFRRIKSVALSIPSVVGPYTGIHCKLTLVRSRVRHTAVLVEGEYQIDGDDDRFSDHFGAMESIVTSTGVNDSGLFETNFRDERYLPFEGSGAISDWRIELPDALRQFDYDSISDVVLHLRYTAREGGNLLRDAAVAHIEDKIEAAGIAGSLRMLSVRHEFPSEWSRFTSQTPTPGQRAQLSLELTERHYPYWAEGKREQIHSVELFARSAKDLTVSNAADLATDSLTRDDSLAGLRHGVLENLAKPDPIGAWELRFDDNQIEDLWIVLGWGGALP